MARKTALPIHSAIALSSRPTVERARQSLGGSGTTSAFAGEIVTMKDKKDARGVVVFSNEEECDVFMEAGFVKRTRRSNVEPVACEKDSPLHELSGEAKVFGALLVNQRVRFEQPNVGTSYGLLFEKCRYGALVAKDDGTIVAVGFRKLWPDAVHSS